MDFREITPDYAVSGQITPEQIAEVKAAGFRSVICNRPDEEQPGQPPASSVERAAEAAGLQFRFIPVVSGQITPADVDKMADALETLEGPVFAYCRSGARCTNLYAMVQGRR